VLTITTRKLPLVLLLMMVIFSAGSLIQLQPVSATFPGANDKIVFTRYVGAVAPQTQIFTMNPDGSGLTQLTFSGDNAWPRWSADGSKIVFQNFPTYAIWIMNADGSGQTQVTHPPASFFNFNPAFSPDGSKIVFRNVSGPNGHIWVTNVDGTNQKPLTTGTVDDYSPVWSPDGLKIVFVRDTPLRHIFVMNPDGSVQTDISKDLNAQDTYPEWSPDGRMIAFQRSPGFAIWVMNVDGSGRKQLSNPAGRIDEDPAWSPDGTKIAFARLIDSIWVMNADGSNPIDITNSANDFAPNWQPLFANPVGGVVMPTSKLEIVAPFAALTGLVVAVSAVVAVKKRRD